MKTLVIGGAGFIGGNLIKTLVQIGHKVISLDNYLSGSTDNHHEGATYIHGCASKINEINFNADIVFHLGEFSRVEQSDHEPWICLSNSYATIHSVLRYCYERGAKLIYSGSSTKFSEAKSPYIVAKRLNTELVREICEQYAIPFAITYFYNVYGPGEITKGKYSTVVGRFIHAKQNSKIVEITGNGQQRRHFTHVDDVVAALLLIANDGYGDSYGIGSEDMFSIIDIANMLGVNYIFTNDKTSNRKQSVLYNEKIKKLGWRAKKNLSEYLVEYRY